MTENAVARDGAEVATSGSNLRTTRWVAPLDDEDATAALAHVLGTGDLYQLSNAQRVAHYINLCRSVGLSPLSRPYQWIEFKETEGGPPVLTLYFKPTAAAQVLRNNEVTFHFTRKEVVGELFVCEVQGRTPTGREGSASKYVPLTNRYGKLQGNRLGNALMSAESGALRRLALHMGYAAGSDVGDGESVRPVYVDGTGAIMPNPTEEQRELADNRSAANAINAPTFESTAESFGEIEVDLPDQAPRPEELRRPQRPAGPVRLGLTAEDVERHRRKWFATVKGTSYDTNAARATYLERYTSQFPEKLRTHSLSTFLSHATERQAQDLLAHIEGLVEREKAGVPLDTREDPADIEPF